MARLRKQIQALNLFKYDVLIEDMGMRSDYFKITQFDGYFYGGRNAFLVAGATVLKPNSKILVEILNVNGETIFSAPVANFVEGNSRLIQVEVYGDTPPGPGKLVVLGCTDTYLNGTPIPSEWRDKYNVRWISDVIISPGINNNTPIRFINPPNLTVSEKFYVSPATSSLSQSFAVPANFELTPINYNIFQNGYLITLLNANSTNKFNADYVGGTLDTVISVANTNEIVSASLPITKIINSTTAESRGTLITGSLGTVIRTAVLSSSGGSYTTRIEPYGTTPITSSIARIKYSKLIESPTTSSFTSFVKFIASNLNTISGEVHKIRLSYKPTTEPGEYVVLGDVPTKVEEILSIDGATNIIELGNFKGVTPSTYWYAATMSISKSDRTTSLPLYYISSSLYTNLNTIKTSDILLDAISTTPEIVGNTFKNNTSYFIGTNKNSNIQLFPNSEYTLKLTAAGTTVSSSINLVQSDVSVEVYLVSSENTTRTTLLNQTNKGQLIATLDLNGNAQQLFENVEFNFTPKIITSGTFGLRFVVYGGFWNFSNISIKPSEEKFFNPDEVSLLIPNVNFSNKLLTIKADYLDINNNSTRVSTLSTPAFFYGPALVSSGRSGASVTISTTPPPAAFAGDLWWNSEEGQLKIYYTDIDNSQWVDASGETIETGSISVESSISSSYALTASYALNGGGGSPTLLQYDNDTLYSTNPPALVSSSYDLSIALGYGTGDSSSIDNSILLGLYAGRYIDYTEDSTIIGYQAAEYLKNTSELIAIGEWTARYADGVGASVAVGIEALGAASASYNTTAIGTLAGSYMKFSDYITLNGVRTGYNALNSSFSNFIGTYAGAYATSSFSTFIGIKSGYEQSGRNNIIIGTDIGLPAGRNDSVNIGGIIFATGSYFNPKFVEPGFNPFYFPSASYTGSVNGRVGINVVNPQYALHVAGTLGFSPGTTVTPINNGDVVVQATNNTTLTFKLKGSDGIVRSGSITLS